jgi:hypothetical protein
MDSRVRTARDTSRSSAAISDAVVLVGPVARHEHEPHGADQHYKKRGQKCKGLQPTALQNGGLCAFRAHGQYGTADQHHGLQPEPSHQQPQPSPHRGMPTLQRRSQRPQRLQPDDEPHKPHPCGKVVNEKDDKPRDQRRRRQQQQPLNGTALKLVDGGDQPHKHAGQQQVAHHDGQHIRHLPPQHEQQVPESVDQQRSCPVPQAIAPPPPTHHGHGGRHHERADNDHCQHGGDVGSHRVRAHGQAVGGRGIRPA